jgi:membrane dipeptidase
MSNEIWMLDAHCDSIYHRHLFGNELELLSTTTKYSKEILGKVSEIFGEATPPPGDYPCHVTLPRLKEGNIKAVFMNVGDLDINASEKMLDGLNALAGEESLHIKICKNVDEISKTVDAGGLAIIPAIEGMLMFHNNLEMLQQWNEYGIRVANLTHGEGTEGITNFAKLVLGDNAGRCKQYALQITPSTEKFMSAKEREQLFKSERGLTGFGKEALLEMQKLGIVCDLSHANDATFWQALEFSDGKFCVTHSNCAALCSHTRNLTDSMMHALTEHGGVMGLCFYGEFISTENPSLEKFIEHILRALEVMGENHVGIGSDYDGVEPGAFMAIPQPALMSQLWEGLNRAGVSDDVICKIAYDNFLRLLG